MGTSVNNDKDSKQPVQDEQAATTPMESATNEQGTEDTSAANPENEDPKTADETVETAEIIEEVTATEEAQPTSSAPDSAPPPPPATAAKKRSWLAIIAIIIALIALGGAGYLYQQLMLLKAESTALESNTNNLQDSLSSTSERTLSLANQSQSQAAKLGDLETSVQQQQANVNELQDRLTRSMKQISQIGNNKRKDWLLAEAEYLLRLANQRVMLEKSPVGALALLKSTDEILRETDDVSIYNVRKAVANDIAALEAVPSLDVDGVFLKLAALNERVDHLSLLPVSETPELPAMLSEMDDKTLVESWKQGFTDSWNKAMEKLGNLIIIQHRDEPIEPLLTHDQAYFIQQNLHLMIEQAQLSLLQGHQPSYDASLNKATSWIGRYFRSEDSSTQALIKGLDELKPVEVSPQLPDISGSLKALKQYFSDVHKAAQG